jgi:hypothetical protein
MYARNSSNILREPVEPLLKRFGIATRRTNREGATLWLSMSECPACKHRDYQCGVAETHGADGALDHTVRCLYAHENPWNTQNPHYLEFLVALGALTPAEADALKHHDQRGPTVTGGTQPLPPRPEGGRDTGVGEPLRPLNLEFLGRLRKRLRDNARAMRWLTEELGLQQATTDHFALGLSMPYERRDGQPQENALVYPLRLADGALYKRYGYYNVPGVTVNPTDELGWMPGSVRAYYADSVGGRKTLFVCEGAKDLWRHWQETHADERTRSLVTTSSTHVPEFPDEWKSPAFWRQWDEVYLGHDSDAAGEEMVARLLKLAGRPARRVVVPSWYGKDWIDYWQGGGTIDEFVRLLGEAPAVEHREGINEIVAPEDAEIDGPGAYAYDPVDINGAFHRGHLYYPVRILQKDCEITRTTTGQDAVQPVEWLETVVVKSDRTIHRAGWVAAPRGKRSQDRVLRLDDGTLIDREPQPNKYGTWSWVSIKKYLDGKAEVRSLGEILRDVAAHLRASVWLPFEEDYVLLALAVPVTYAQNVFESVPLLFVNGPKGSGKSGLGRALALVCANAYICGQSSAASIARFIDESRGFVVLDDLEVIGNRGNEFSELVQALKLSYTKKTATKIWTDVKTMRTKQLNFYGVKLINNTSGADDILSSRMFRVQTRRLPDHCREEFLRRKPLDAPTLASLRDELHTWAFDSVAQVDAEYRKLFPKLTDRAQEIEAPLKVMARLSGDAELMAGLEVALARQKLIPTEPNDPRFLLREALRGLVIQGYVQFSATHLLMEMRSLAHYDPDKTSSEDAPDWSRVEWVGRMLRSRDLVDPDVRTHGRKRLYGANLRLYHIHHEFAAEVAKEYAEEMRAKYGQEDAALNVLTQRWDAFCQSCAGCPYRHVGCEIMPRRMKAEASESKSLKAHG